MGTRRLLLEALIWATASMALGGIARAEEATDPVEGLLPLPDYAGDLRNRAYLTGDWGGTRSALAARGVQLDVGFTQIVESVVDGGLDTDTRYGGRVDYDVTLDLHRMGLIPGALVEARAESRYGESVNGIAGAILPVDTDGFFPLEGEIDEDIAITLTTLTYTQFLSEKFGLMFGKFDTLNADPNEFASGRGTSQFLNANFIFNAAVALTAPYSTLGGGVLWMPARSVTIVSLVYNTTDASTTSGFDDIGDGTSWSTEAQLQYRVGELPGGQNVGVVYSFDDDFTEIGGRFVFQPGQGITAPSENSTWAVYWSAWQYLHIEDASDSAVDVTNGRTDHQGIGLFARAGFADRDTNPVEWSLSGGLGGRGILPTRDDDTFGIGYYFIRIRDTRLGGVLDVDDESRGFEVWYDVEVTPAVHLTLDAQVVDSPDPRADTATILGVRFGMTF